MRRLELAVSLLFCLGLAVESSGGPEFSEVDIFIEKVLVQRDINWADLDQYVFRETESMALVGPGGVTIEKEDAEYARYVRGGVLVRSPVSVDGVAVSAKDRKRREDEWFRQERERLDEREREDGKTTSRRYFLDLEYEPGNYFFAGRGTFEGREVTRIEYYPQHLFDDDHEHGGDDDDDDDDAPAADDDADDDDEDEDAAIERKLSKTTTITMLVLPEEHQIVKITFHNTGLDFLPMRWLVRFDGIEMSMTMHQPIAGVWLPREIIGCGGATTAAGTIRFAYHRRFFDYAEAAVSTSIELGRPESIR